MTFQDYTNTAKWLSLLSPNLNLSLFTKCSHQPSFVLLYLDTEKSRKSLAMYMFSSWKFSLTESVLEQKPESLCILFKVLQLYPCSIRRITTTLFIRYIFGFILLVLIFVNSYSTTVRWSFSPLSTSALFMKNFLFVPHRSGYIFVSDNKYGMRAKNPFKLLMEQIVLASRKLCGPVLQFQLGHCDLMMAPRNHNA